MENGPSDRQTAALDCSADPAPVREPVDASDVESAGQPRDGDHGGGRSATRHANRLDRVRPPDAGGRLWGRSVHERALAAIIHHRKAVDLPTGVAEEDDRGA